MSPEKLKERHSKKEEEARELIFEVYGKGVKINKFFWKNKHLYVEMVCPRGHLGKRRVSAIRIRGKSCRQCGSEKASISRRYAQLSSEKIKTLQDRGFKMVGELVNISTPTEFECSRGHRHSRKPNDIVAINCPQCREDDRIGKIRDKTALDLTNKSYHDGRLELILYKNPSIAKVNTHLTPQTKKVEVVCAKGHTFVRLKGNLLNKGGITCQECQSLKRHKEVQSELDNLYGGTFKLLTRFKSEGMLVTTKCLNCGEISQVTGYCLARGSGCPNCFTTSKGEAFFKHLANTLGVPMEAQVGFDDLLGVGGGKLRYDFMIGSDTLVEINGEQHYKPCTFGYLSKEQAINKFEIQNEHDKRKRAYVRANGYKLIEIPYTRGVDKHFKKACNDVLQRVAKELRSHKLS